MEPDCSGVLVAHLDMKFRFLSYYYPPLQAPRAIQVSRLARHLDSFCRVVTCGRPGMLKNESSENLHITRYPRLPTAGFFDRILHRYFLNFAFRPDALRWWALSVAGKELENNPFEKDEILVTFGTPMSDHLAGLVMKRKSGSPWMAHFSDPWSDNPYRPDLPGRREGDRVFEEAVFAEADRLIFTSQQTVDLVMRGEREQYKGKCRVLPHAYEESLFDKDKNKPERDYLLIRHTGNLYGRRKPHALFKALTILLNSTRTPPFKFVFTGVTEGGNEDLIGKAKALPDGMIQFEPAVPYLESLKLLENSDALLSIDAPASAEHGGTSVFLPSKLADYAGSGKPVFSLSPPGAARDFVEQLGGVCADPAEPEEIARNLSNFLRELQSGKLPYNSVFRDNYRAEKIAGDFAKIAGELLGA